MVAIAFSRLDFIPIAPAVRLDQVLIQVIFGIHAGFPLHLRKIGAETTGKTDQFSDDKKEWTAVYLICGCIGQGLLKMPGIKLLQFDQAQFQSIGIQVWHAFDGFQFFGIQKILFDAFQDLVGTLGSLVVGRAYFGKIVWFQFLLFANDVHGSTFCLKLQVVKLDHKFGVHKLTQGWGEFPVGLGADYIEQQQGKNEGKKRSFHGSKFYRKCPKGFTAFRCLTIFLKQTKFLQTQRS